MTYFTVRDQNHPGQLNPFRATPVLFELIAELSVVIAMKDVLPDHSYEQLVIQYD